jgi:hypothetical protein
VYGSAVVFVADVGVSADVAHREFKVSLASKGLVARAICRSRTKRHATPTIERYTRRHSSIVVFAAFNNCKAAIIASVETHGLDPPFVMARPFYVASCVVASSRGLA